MFESEIREGVLRVTGDGIRWLSSGWNGGFSEASAAYNISVPSAWERDDIDGYVSDRLASAGFSGDGPCLLTAVDLSNARGARTGLVVGFVTVGLSNPATLPIDPSGSIDRSTTESEMNRPGTVNIIVGVEKSLTPGAAVSLLGGIVEAKTATLLSETGFTGTTTDAVIIGWPGGKDRVQFTGSATRLGQETRACIRDAIRAGLQSRYESEPAPRSVDAAEHGSVTNRTADVFEL